jgi:hypothetical protein
MVRKEGVKRRLGAKKGRKKGRRGQREKEREREMKGAECKVARERRGSSKRVTLVPQKGGKKRRKQMRRLWVGKRWRQRARRRRSKVCVSVGVVWQLVQPSPPLHPLQVCMRVFVLFFYAQKMR